MKFLRQNKKNSKTKSLNESDFFVLTYEQLIMVNGAGGKSSKSSSTPSPSPSTPPAPSSTDDSANRG